MDITDRMNTFREASRHIWNTCFRTEAQRNQDWDLRDAFSEIHVALFNAIVRFHLPDSAPAIPHLWEPEQTVLSPYRLTGKGARLPLMVNRDRPASGYWDHPTEWVEPGKVDLRLITIWDWDNLGFRDFRYFRVRIANADDPDIVDRDALADAADCQVEYLGVE